MSTSSFLKNNYLIFLLLLVASVLRLFGLFDLQYTFDELSALSRTGFSSFTELIDKGVKTTDTHPALIQVFLNYYTAIFGTNEWVVKLPFICLGIASVYLVYWIGKRWFNETVGLLTAALLVCSQYFVFYSVVARPYISGLFLSMFALKYWMEILFNTSAKNKDYIGFILLTTLSALNHHFSMMFVALCGIFGLFFLSKINAKKYILACLISVILYMPHLPILLFQFNIGGIGVASGGWLDPPANDFIVKFLFYIFHYSYVFLIVFIGVIIFAHFKIKQNLSNNQYKIRFIWFLLFATNFLIGFFYSKYFNPVLQFSTLIFSVPCLVLFICSFANEISAKNKLFFISLILIIGISTLVVKRKYYDLVYNQSFDAYIKTANEISKEKGNNNVYSIFKGEPWFLDFYKKKYHSLARFEVIEGEFKKASDYKNIYDTLSARYLILGNFNPTQLLQASIYFPYTYKKVIGYGYELYVLSKDSCFSSLDVEQKIITKTNFVEKPKGFDLNRDLIMPKNNRLYYKVDSLNEFPLSFKIKNTDIHAIEGQWVITKINYQTDNQIKGLLCGSIDALKKNAYWTASDLDAFYNSKGKMQSAYLAVYVSSNFNKTDNELTFFVWNNNKEKLLISEFSIYIWDNNPYHYGLLNDF